jgi:hypothetical protein
MKKPYFVMLRHPNGEYFLPLVDDDNEIVQFSTKAGARVGAETSSLGSETGYEIFDFGDGL